MDALTILQNLYLQRDYVNEQIGKIEAILEATPTTEAKVKQKRTRGPNKPKQTEVPHTTM